MLTQPHERPLRLLLGIDSGVWGGAESWVASLLRELPDRVERTLVATDPVPERLIRAAEGRAELVVIPAIAGKLDVRGLRRLSGVLRDCRPDVVHVNSSEPSNNRHLLLLASRRVPTVVALHLWSPVPTTGLQGRALRAGYRSAAEIVVVSQALRRHVVDELGVHSRSVRVVANGVQPLPPVVLRGDPHPLRVGILCRLVEHKGVDLAVAALARLTPSDPAVELVVAGEGPQRGELERAARGLPVRLLGAVDDAAGFLAGLDVFLLPSRDEGLPLALLEAMSAGLPCLVTDVGDVAEAVGDGALVVPPGSAEALAEGLVHLATDEDLRRRLGRTAKARVQQGYTAQTLSRTMMGVYDGVRRR